MNYKLKYAIEIAVGIITRENITREIVSDLGIWYDDGSPIDELEWERAQEAAAEILYNRLSKLSGE